ncbi:hypothetical protein PIROE2DRAFT_6743 [Piromyces sp. E2]|nr:hypothetical protein PIROE2DRAFT_6743 [Piromyces sp. E2]|eukprot:OUM66121.1 hypothetical protein PIROE2DRAFT_6743 [Piromyces sp. E2]
MDVSYFQNIVLGSRIEGGVTKTNIYFIVCQRAILVEMENGYTVMMLYCAGYCWYNNIKIKPKI